MKGQIESERRPPFVAITGNIGVGKSGLTRALADALGAVPLLEEPSRNPFFARFYEDPARWAFSSQVAFAADALRRQIAAVTESAVLDRTAYEACDVFGRVLHEDGHLADEEFKILETLRDCALALPRHPDLILHLRASVPSMARRIANRNRTPERKIEVAYLERLESQYRVFLSSWTLSPVLCVNTDSRDLRQGVELDALVAEVRHGAERKKER